MKINYRLLPELLPELDTDELDEDREVLVGRSEVRDGVVETLGLVGRSEVRLGVLDDELLLPLLDEEEDDELPEL